MERIAEGVSCPRRCGDQVRELISVPLREQGRQEQRVLAWLPQQMNLAPFASLLPLWENTYYMELL